MHLASALIRVPPLKFPSLPCSLPSSLNPSSAHFLPPLFPLRRPCLGPSLPRSFPSATLPPSTLPSSTDALSLPIIVVFSLSSLPPSPLSLPLLPPSLAPSLPCSHPPSHPPLAPSHPPSFLAPSLACLPAAVQFNVHRMCVWQAALYCVAPSDAWHWDNEWWQQPALFKWRVVTFSERTPNTNPFLANSKKIRRSTRATNTTETRSTLVPFRGYRRRLPEPSRTGAKSDQK